MAGDVGSILIVDDDDNCSSLVSALLTRAGFSTIEAATGDAALAMARSHHPSVVLLDVNLPGVNGYEVCRELKDKFGQELPVVFLSGERTEPFDRVAGLLIGADDYIVKPFDPDELVARVRRLAVRTTVETSRRAEAGLAGLSPRENEVFRLLADGLSQREIADRLFISERTVATHIQRILGKLGVHSRAQAVAVAARNGLVSPEA